MSLLENQINSIVNSSLDLLKEGNESKSKIISLDDQTQVFLSAEDNKFKISYSRMLHDNATIYDYNELVFKINLITNDVKFRINPTIKKEKSKKDSNNNSYCLNLEKEFDAEPGIKDLKNFVNSISLLHTTALYRLGLLNDYIK